eukprot:194485-Alexandrium_andersonii.AAC.1
MSWTSATCPCSTRRHPAGKSKSSKASSKAMPPTATLVRKAACSRRSVLFLWIVRRMTARAT